MAQYIYISEVLNAFFTHMEQQAALRGPENAVSMHNLINHLLTASYTPTQFCVYAGELTDLPAPNYAAAGLALELNRCPDYRTTRAAKAAIDATQRSPFRH